jgi:hydroxyethylthiazole kinase
MLEAAAAAISFYGLCGETAAASAQGPGSLQTLLLDNLYHLPREAMDQGCRLIRL